MSDATTGQALTMSGAAFDVFRDRGRRGVLLTASLGYLAIVVLVFGLFGFVFWRAIGDYFTWSMANASGAVTMPPHSVLGLIPGYCLIIFVSYVALAAYEAAALKWMVRGEAGGMFLGLSLGADTWRVWFGYWIWFFLLIGLYIAVILITIIVAGVLGAAQLDAGIVGLVSALAAIAGLCAFLWIGIRLAPASATSVALNRFAFFNAWTVTRGKFWALFGNYLILILLYIVGAAVIFGIGFGLLMGPAIMRLASAGTEPTPEQVMALFTTPQMIIGAVLVYGVYLAAVLVFYLAFLSVSARTALVAKQEGRIS